MQNTAAGLQLISRYTDVKVVILSSCVKHYMQLKICSYTSTVVCFPTHHVRMSCL